MLLFLSSLFLDPEHPERPDTPEYSTGPAWRSVSTVRAAPIPEFSSPAESVQNRRISLNNNIKESDRSGLTNGIYGQLQHHLAYSPCRRLLTRCGEDEIDVLALHCTVPSPSQCSSRAAWCQLSGRVARAEEWLSECLVGTLDPGLMSVHQLFHAGPFQSDRARPKCTGRQRERRPVGCNPEMGSWMETPSRRGGESDRNRPVIITITPIHPFIRWIMACRWLLCDVA